MLFDRSFRRVGDADAVSLSGENLTQGVGDNLLILDDQDSSFSRPLKQLSLPEGESLRDPPPLLKSKDADDRFAVGREIY